ncbi:MAG: DUF169 domain-containing protein [bacterium]|nr:DUF169 domain-containing protein [bacterium]
MIPNPAKLIDKLELTIPFICVYDAPDAAAFEPLVKPEPKEQICVFQYYTNWLKNETLHLTAENFGCGGCGRSMFSIQGSERQEFLKFLAETEGLKESTQLMGRWLDSDTPYKPKHANIMVGPLLEAQFQYIETITFFVNPDQLSGLTIGAQYWTGPEEPVPPVMAPFGSGCMQLLPLFKDLDFPQAIVGATDLAMRQFIPPQLLAFTVTMPMYRKLCRLDEDSFLYKPFLKNLQEARKKDKMK